MRTFLPHLGITVAFGTSVAMYPSRQAQEGAMVEGAGYTMFNTESIKGSDTSKLERTPSAIVQAPPYRQDRAG